MTPPLTGKTRRGRALEYEPGSVVSAGPAFGMADYGYCPSLTTKLESLASGRGNILPTWRQAPMRLEIQRPIL
jgi:hypothetical protein